MGISTVFVYWKIFTLPVSFFSDYIQYTAVSPVYDMLLFSRWRDTRQARIPFTHGLHWFQALLSFIILLKKACPQKFYSIVNIFRDGFLYTVIYASDVFHTLVIIYTHTILNINYKTYLGTYLCILRAETAEQRDCNFIFTLHYRDYGKMSFIHLIHITFQHFCDDSALLVYNFDPCLRSRVISKFSVI